jgi:hypothetical protein
MWSKKHNDEYHLRLEKEKLLEESNEEKQRLITEKTLLEGQVMDLTITQQQLNNELHNITQTCQFYCQAYTNEWTINELEKKKLSKQSAQRNNFITKMMKEITELQEITQNVTLEKSENNIVINEEGLLDIDWISNIVGNNNDIKDTQNDPMDWESFYDELIKDL